MVIKSLFLFSKGNIMKYSGLRHEIFYSNIFLVIYYLIYWYWLNYTKDEIKKALERNLKSTIILGPSPCAIIRIKDTFRFGIILKYKKEDLLIETLEKIINHYRDNDKITVDIDFNPNHF